MQAVPDFWSSLIRVRSLSCVVVDSLVEECNCFTSSIAPRHCIVALRKHVFPVIRSPRPDLCGEELLSVLHSGSRGSRDERPAFLGAECPVRQDSAVFHLGQCWACPGLAGRIVELGRRLLDLCPACPWRNIYLKVCTVYGELLPYPILVLSQYIPNTCISPRAPVEVHYCVPMTARTTCRPAMSCSVPLVSLNYRSLGSH